MATIGSIRYFAFEPQPARRSCPSELIIPKDPCLPDPVSSYREINTEFTGWRPVLLANQSLVLLLRHLPGEGACHVVFKTRRDKRANLSSTSCELCCAHRNHPDGRAGQARPGPGQGSSPTGDQAC